MTLLTDSKALPGKEKLPIYLVSLPSTALGRRSQSRNSTQQSILSRAKCAKRSHILTKRWIYLQTQVYSPDRQIQYLGKVDFRVRP